MVYFAGQKLLSLIWSHLSIFGFISVTLVKVKMLVAQLCRTLCNPMDCSPPGSSVHGILQAGILEWVAIFSSREYSQFKD